MNVKLSTETCLKLLPLTSHEEMRAVRHTPQRALEPTTSFKALHQNHSELSSESPPPYDLLEATQHTNVKLSPETCLKLLPLTSHEEMRTVRNTPQRAVEPNTTCKATHQNHSELSSESPPPYDLLEAFFKIARETNETTEARVLAVKGIEEIYASPSASRNMCFSLTDDAIDSVVTAMQSIPDHRFMQRLGCRALTHLASLLSSQNSDGGAHSISKVSAIRAVISAMDFHSVDSQVTLNGLCALLNLSRDCSSCYEIVASSGTRPIVAAMSNHSTDNTIWRY